MDAGYAKENMALKILKAREKRIKFLQNEIVTETCRRCAGRCCSVPLSAENPLLVRLSPMRFSEVIYLFIVRKNFIFPEPDWNFLKERNEVSIESSRRACIFLSDEGCLLKNDRPVFCLNFICGPLFCNLEREHLLKEDAITKKELHQAFFSWHNNLKRRLKG